MAISGPRWTRHRPLGAGHGVTTPSAAGRMTAIDGLRGVAALGVLVAHAKVFLPAGPGGWARAARQAVLLGAHGVDVFFVLSGFVIAYSLRSTRVDARAFGRFALRRSLRLDPPYWAAIALMALARLARVRLGLGPVPQPQLKSILAHLVYAQNLLGFRAINGVFWTLCLEVQFYLVFCAALGLLARGRPVAGGRFPAAVFGGSYVLSLAIWTGRIDLGRAPVHFPALWHEFILGALTWWAVSGAISRRWLVALAAASAALWTPATRAHEVAALATSGFIAACAARGTLTTSLGLPLLQAVGRASYSLYLVHMPVALLLSGAQARFAPGSPRAVPAYIAAYLGLSMAGTWAFHRWIERPSLRWSRRPEARGAAGAEGARSKRRTIS